MGAQICREPALLGPLDLNLSTPALCTGLVFSLVCLFCNISMTPSKETARKRESGPRPQTLNVHRRPSGAGLIPAQWQALREPSHASPPGCQLSARGPITGRPRPHVRSAAEAVGITCGPGAWRLGPGWRGAAVRTGREGARGSGRPRTLRNGECGGGGREGDEGPAGPGRKRP